jgi:hypothetical protein
LIVFSPSFLEPFEVVVRLARMATNNYADYLIVLLYV